jgi:energy-coupling factor transporter ATP-binding protein EcfA2
MTARRAWVVDTAHSANDETQLAARQRRTGWEDTGIVAMSTIDPRLERWLMAQLAADSKARLVEAGAGADARIELADVFIDLPVRVGEGNTQLMDTLCNGPSQGSPFRVLLVGGPGSGKSTAATMVAQVLRSNRLADRDGLLEKLRKRMGFEVSSGIVPLRVSLPELARESATGDATEVWRYLAHRLDRELPGDGPTTVDEVHALVRSGGRPYWIFDGLDEVPPSAGRSRVVAAVRAALAPEDHVLVTTRPQGYRGELDELEMIELLPLEPEHAQRYGQRLLSTWGADGIDQLRQPSVASLLQTPLHVTMATLLVAEHGALPASRWQLYELYFEILFRRELRRLASIGVRAEHKDMVRAIHARVGLRLQVLAQQREGAASEISRGALRAIITGLLLENGYTDESARSTADRLLTFATERLVLLLQPVEGSYSFGIRTLQEFFAADALLAKCEPGVLRQRFQAIALAPLWENVLRIAASGLAIQGDRLKEAIEAMADLCRDIDSGALGEGASRCHLGAALAVTLLSEIQEYALAPKLVNALWGVAFGGLYAPVYRAISANNHRTSFQQTRILQVDVGEVASRSTDEAVHDRLVREAGTLLAGRPTADRVRGHLVLRRASTLPGATALMAEHPTQPDEEGLQSWPELAVWRHPLTREPLRDSHRSQLLLRVEDLVFKVLPVGSTLAIRAPIAAHPAWEAIAAFHEGPSAATLAEAVRACAEPHGAMRRYARFFAWPLAACLAWTAPEQLHALADAVRRGELGGLDDWRVAEARWREGSPTRDDLRGWLADPLPFSANIGKTGLALPGGPSSWVPARKNELQQLALAFLWTGATQYKASRFLVECASAFGPLQIALDKVQSLPANLDPDLQRIGILMPCLEGAETEGWFALLEEWGQKPAGPIGGDMDGEISQELAERLLDRLITHPGSWGLERLLLALTVFPWVKVSTLPALPPGERPPWARAIRAALLLAAGAGASEDIKDLDWSEEGEPSSYRFEVAYLLARRKEVDDLPTLLAILDATPEDDLHTTDVVLRAVHDIVRSQHVPFSTPEEWRAHELPGPFPMPPPRPPRLVAIEELSALRLFHETPTCDVPFPIPDNPDKGQWILLLGENGSGKTTLLRSLALAIAAPAVTSKLLDERLPLTRNGGEAKVAVQLDTGRYGVVVQREDRLETVRSDGDEPSVRPWIVGYGVRRGNARGDKDREALGGPVGEMHTLFDLPASLTNAVEWLKDLDRQVLREQKAARNGGPAGPRQAIWHAVVRALQAVLGIEAVEPDETHVYVKHPQFGRVRLDALSDGYLTTAGWVVDLIARWVERKRELEEPIGPDLLSEMTGIVLIDEIDLHLHPVWQLRVIEDLRGLFPRLSFVATTHNPLTVLGAAAGETYVVRRDGDKVELVQQDVLPGHDIDRVLFEQFGVEHTFDRLTRDLLKEHRDLLEQGTPETDPRRAEIERQLQELLGPVGRVVRANRARATGPAQLGDDELHLADLLRKRPDQ